MGERFGEMGPMGEPSGAWANPPDIEAKPMVDHSFDGPTLRVEATCFNCKHERSESYRAQGDSGHVVVCDHPDIGGRRVGDTTWKTPRWCPLLARQEEALGESLAAAKLAASEAARAKAEASLEQLAAKWAADDQPLPEDDAIDAVFPTRSERHDLYGEAMRLVGAKRSKGGLVSLVNWLLHRAEKHRGPR